MRFIIPLSLFILLISLLLPLLLISSPEFEELREEEETPEAVEAAAVAEPPPLHAPEPQAGQGTLDESIMLQVLIGDEVIELSMAAYLRGVVAAEMPARFHPEALKAQAVAARTYTLHRTLIAPTPRHPEAYVCGSYACCKAYHDEARLRERWGADYEHYSAIIAQAIAETDGLILVYENQPILAAFHSSSYGYTEASGAIWGDVPYLQSVRSHEGPSEVPNYYSTTELSYAEFRQIATNFPGVTLEEGNTPYWIRHVIYTDSGRLGSIEIGGVTLTGPEFRRLFSLRSTAITFTFGDTHMTITTGGYGHGVGMSQFGANTMAELGLGFAAILDWYYTGVNLISAESLFSQGNFFEREQAP